MLGENTALYERDLERPVGPGTVLRDRFLLQERLEHGRLGAVYKALDRHHSTDADRHVAVLVLPAEIARNPAHLEAFRRELAAVQSLDHPHIVDVHDLECDGPIHFLIMEWIDGEALRSVIDSLSPEPIAEEEAWDVVHAVGAALVYAHAKGVVHGDVRAENVLVAGRHEVKVLFAPACLARSAPFTIDVREDLRGLAALAYELLTGALPPAAGLDVAALLPPSIAALGRRRREALRSALSLRDERIRTVQQLLDALGTGGRDVRRARSARGTGARPRGRRIGAGVLVLCGLAAAGAATAWWWSRAPASPSERSFQLSLPQVPVIVAEAGERTREAVNAVRGALEVLAGEVGRALRAGRDGQAGREASEGPRGESSGEAAEGTGREETRVPGAPDAGSVGDGGENAPAERGGEEAAEDRARGGGRRPLAAAAPAVGRSSAVSRQPTTGRGGSGAGRSRPAIGFARPELAVSEGQSVAAIEITRGDARGELRFVWWLGDGTAVSGDDYADLGRVVEQFRDGDSAVTVLVPITSDAVAERREHFYVYLSALSAQDTQLGRVREAIITIVDDD